MNNYCVYKHTSPSGKSYIGQTNNLARRNYQHQTRSYCTYFYKAICKYGWNSFTHEILMENLTIKEANHWEMYYIEFLNSMAPNGYNLTTGGNNAVQSIVTRQKRSAIRRLRIQPKHTEETKRKLSLIKTGFRHSLESKQKMSLIHTGFKHSEEYKQKMSKSKKEVPLSDKHKQSLKGPRQPTGNQSILQCPHCGKCGHYSNMKRWHFDNCKLKNFIPSTFLFNNLCKIKFLSIK